MSWVKAADYVVRDTPEFIFELEEFRRGDDQMMFVHLTVRKWTKDVLKQLRHEFTLFRKCVTCPLYAVAGDDASGKWESFVSFFGFQPLIDVVCENGQPRRMFWLPPIEKKNAQSVPTDATDQPEHGKHVEQHLSVVGADTLHHAGLQHGG